MIREVVTLPARCASVSSCCSVFAIWVFIFRVIVFLNVCVKAEVVVVCD